MSLSIKITLGTSHFFSSPVSRLQDKAQPETQARVFGDVGFNALLAVDDPSALSLVRQPGSDGFRLDSTAMFQVLATISLTIPLHSTLTLGQQF